MHFTLVCYCQGDECLVWCWFWSSSQNRDNNCAGYLHSAFKNNEPAILRLWRQKCAANPFKMNLSSRELSLEFLSLFKMSCFLQIIHQKEEGQVPKVSEVVIFSIKLVQQNGQPLCAERTQFSFGFSTTIQNLGFVFSFWPPEIEILATKREFTCMSSVGPPHRSETPNIRRIWADLTTSRAVVTMERTCRWILFSSWKFSSKCGCNMLFQTSAVTENHFSIFCPLCWETLSPTKIQFFSNLTFKCSILAQNSVLHLKSGTKQSLNHD